MLCTVAARGHLRGPNPAPRYFSTTGRAQVGSGQAISGRGPGNMQATSSSSGTQQTLQENLRVNGGRGSEREGVRMAMLPSLVVTLMPT